MPPAPRRRISAACLASVRRRMLRRCSMPGSLTCRQGSRHTWRWSQGVRAALQACVPTPLAALGKAAKQRRTAQRGLARILGQRH